MPRKEKSVHCPNCGAPVPAVLTFGNMVKCEYCGSYVNISEFFQSKAPTVTAPVSPSPVQRQQRSSEQRPKVTYKPEDYIDYKKPRRKFTEEDFIAVTEVVLGIIIFFCLRGCILG